MTDNENKPVAWMTIETAPKDFTTNFDGWNGDRITDVYWGHPEYSPKDHYAWCVSAYDHQGQITVEVRNLTHWMPIPAEPSSENTIPTNSVIVDKDEVLEVLGSLVAIDNLRGPFARPSDTEIEAAWKKIQSSITLIEGVLS